MITFKKFVINLKRREDRLRELKLPFDYEIFEATDGKIHFPNEVANLVGHLGCWDSHRRLLEKIKEENIEYTLIFEDDAVVCDDFIKKMEIVVSELPEDWDLLYLGGWNTGEIKKYSEHLNLAEDVLTTHSYLIRQKFVDTLLSSIYNRKFKIDVVFCDALKKGKCFISNPVLSWQREGYSDIVNKVTNNVHLK